MPDYFIHSVSQPFPPTALRRRHAQTVRDRCSSSKIKHKKSYKIDYVIVIKYFLNPEGHQNPISGPKVMVILLKGWILPIGGSSFSGGGPALQPAQQACFCFISMFSFYKCLRPFVTTSVKSPTSAGVAPEMPLVPDEILKVGVGVSVGLDCRCTRSLPRTHSINN